MILILTTLDAIGLENYKNEDNSIKYRPNEIRNYTGEQSVKDLISNNISAVKYYFEDGEQKEKIETIDQGKFMRDSNNYGKNNGNVVNGSSDDLFNKIRTLDDYYKYQILKKKIMFQV